MKALCVQTGTTIAPYGNPVGQCPVLGTALARVQADALAQAGVALVDTPPEGEPYVVFSDRTWFTAEAIRRVVAAGPGRLHVDHPGWWAFTGALQDTPSPGLYELGVHPGGQGGLAGLDARTVDLGLEAGDVGKLHPAYAHAGRPVFSGRAMVHQVDHWSHLLRVNHLALAHQGIEAKAAWDAAPWWRKLWQGLGMLFRARSVDGFAIARALTEQGKNVRIHPTAVVELCRLGDDVEIGPHAVVRASVLGNGVKIEEHATVLLSSLGPRTQVGRYGFVNLSVAWPGAAISTGGGFQVCVFGEDSFVAWGATAHDLSFGKTIRVDHGGARVDSGQHFLGAAIGHRVRIGNGVRIGYGASIPNDAFVVGPSADLLRKWTDTPVDEGPVVVRDGLPAVLRRPVKPNED